MARPEFESLLAESGWLRNLCRSLIRDRHLAEDVEQQTWLAAMRAEPPQGSALRRWLRAVVANFARQSLRRADVPRASEHPVESVSDLPAPGSALERAEFRRAVVEAVLALDEPYRSTVILRYFEEQSFDRIASDQGVPISTVRTRLQRGLERLRRRLEDEYQGGWAIWAAFLGRHKATPVAATATLGSTLLATAIWFKFALGTALVVGLSIVGWRLMNYTPSTTPVVTGSPTSGSEGSISRATILEPAPATTTGGESRRVPVAGETPPPPGPDALIRGRLLLENGAPAAGAEVSLLATAHWSSSGRSEIVERTAADGSFAVPIDPRPFAMFRLDIKRPGYAHERWSWAEIRPGETRDIGEYTLRRAGAVEGRVVDVHGALLGAQGWTILAEPEIPPPIPSHMTPRERGRVDHNTATFRIEDLPPGRVALTASSQATGRFRGPMVDVVAGQTVHVDIVYEGPDLAQRVVVATSTSPFPSTIHFEPEHVVLRGPDAEPRHPVRLEERSEWFAFDDLEDGVYSIEIDAPDCARWRQNGIVPGSLVRARIEGNAAVDLRVVDGDGAPLSKFTVRARNRNVTSTRREFVVHDGEEPLPAGRLPGFFPGDYSLTVEADGHGARMVDVDDLRADETRHVLVVLEPPRVLAGRVLFPDGSPATGVELFLLTPAVVDDSPSSPVLPPNAAVNDRTRYRVQVDSVPADDEGRFAFTLSRRGSVLVRALRGVGIQVTSAPLDLDEPDEEELVLTIPRGASITGRLWDPGLAPGPGLRLIANPGGDLDEHTRFNLQNRSTVHLGPEGTYEVGPLPRGETELRLLLASPPQVDLHDGGRTVGGVVLETLELREGEDVARDILLGEHRPVPVSLRLAAPVGSVFRGRLTLVPVSDRYLHTQVQGVIETGGTFGPVLLFPGEWKVRVEGQGERWTYEHPTSITIRAGAPNEPTLTMELARGTLQLLDASTTQPLANRDFLLDCPGRDGFQARPLRADADGRVQVVLQGGTYVLGLVPLDEPGTIIAARTAEFVWTAQGPARGDVRL